MMSDERTDFVTAYRFLFGCNKSEAIAVYKDLKQRKQQNYINTVICTFRANAQKAWQDD